VIELNWRTSSLLFFLVSIPLILDSLRYLRPESVLAVLSSALAFGVLGSLLAFRRMSFIAAAAPHSSLLAVALGIALAFQIGSGSVMMYSALIAIGMLSVIGLMLYRGFEADAVTSVFVGVTSSLSVVALYYVMTVYGQRLSVSISSLMFGDPLLISRRDALTVAAVSALFLLYTLLTYRVHVCLGVDRDSVLLSGKNVLIYDLTLTAMVALVSTVMLTSVGYIVEHVLILTPPYIAFLMSESACGSIWLSAAISVFAASLGLRASIPLNVAPSGMFGIVLLTLYIWTLIRSKGRTQ